ncbi:MAG: hypothetical protein KKB46_02885, partial [Candidatus Omnitrophica bacterium]|nr:hypothetical protein [Candidatus Omnitrophota bacterium]
NHYLAYQLLKNRLEFGYDPTTESTYTGGSNKLHFHPSSEKHAMKFIDDQKELLTIARRLIEEEGYEPLIYEGRPFDFHAAFAELDDKEKSIGALRKNTNDPERFASVYELSFYPALKSEPLAVLDLLSVFADEPVVRIVLRRERPQAFIDKFEAAEQVRIRGKGLRVKKLHDRGLSLSEEWGIPAIPVYLNAWRELNPDAPEINAMEYPEEVFGMMTDDFRANKALDPLKNYPDFKWLSHESRTGSFVFYYEVGGKAYTVEVKKSNREATVEIGLPEIEIPDGPLRSDI